MQTLILTIHIVVCALIILVVLVQAGKGGGITGMFGGGGGDALFSAPSGSSFMRKLTTGLAVTFFTTAILLTYLAARKGRQTVTQRNWSAPQQQAPAGQQTQAPLAVPNAQTNQQTEEK